MNPDTFKNNKRKPVTRPGIAPETLAANGVRRVGATESGHLCGADCGGIWIPYHKLEGGPIREENIEFGRLRLHGEIDGKRYHSRAGSRSHLYQPAQLIDLITQVGRNTLYLTEGEFKALSLAEAGVAAAGVSGICNAAPGNRLVDELQLLLTDSQFDRVVFVGDADVGINADFSRAMAKLANALPDDVDLAVIAPGLAAPAKGIDDTRDFLGDGFPSYWVGLTAGTVPVPRGYAWESLALTLLRRESPAELDRIVNDKDDGKEAA